MRALPFACVRTKRLRRPCQASRCMIEQPRSGAGATRNRCCSRTTAVTRPGCVSVAEESSAPATRDESCVDRVIVRAPVPRSHRDFCLADATELRRMIGIAYIRCAATARTPGLPGAPMALDAIILAVSGFGLRLGEGGLFRQLRGEDCRSGLLAARARAGCAADGVDRRTTAAGAVGETRA